MSSRVADQKIRTQIAECALFVPLISANTQARLEGYFRLEWRLAEQRSHLMAKGKRFLVPACIDDTREKGAQVPDAFMEVQWTRLAGGVATTQFVELVKRLMGGEVARVSRPVSSDNTGQETRATKTGVPAAAWIGALAVVAIGVAAVFFAMRKPESTTPLASSNAGAGTRPPTTEKTAAPTRAEKSVAVLAFENQSGDRDNEYFSDGISDELLTQLGKVPGLRVAGRNSSFAFKGKPGAEAEVAQKLNVAYVVNGTVQKAGTQVKITARLINAADGFEVWSDKFTEEMKDIFAVQEKIAGLIAQNLSLKLSGGSRVAKSVDPEAQRLVLEGRFHWNLRTPEGFTRAETAFDKAIAIAPDFAEAHCGLGAVCVVRANFDQLDGVKDSTADLSRARIEAERALALDVSLFEAHAVLGFALNLERRWVESEQSFQRALAISPNSALVRCWYGTLLACRGRFDLSVAEYRRAAELDPLWFMNLVTLAARLGDARRWSESLDVVERALALRPGGFIPAQGPLARALASLGRLNEAVEEVRRMRQRMEEFPRWHLDAHAVSILREAGLEEEAADYAAQTMARKGLPPNSYVRGYVLGALGRFDEALPFLERVPAMITIGLLADSIWDPWRNDARFHQLIAKLGVTEEHKTARETLARMQREQAGKK